MNEYDSNRLADLLKKTGYERTEDPDDIDCYIQLKVLDYNYYSLIHAVDADEDDDDVLMDIVVPQVGVFDELDASQVEVRDVRE